MRRRRAGEDSKDAERRYWRAVRRERPRDVLPAGPGQESVWDYPRPPRIEPFPRQIRVDFAGVTVASSRASLRVLETSSPPVFYIPPHDIQDGVVLDPAARTTFCEWKGSAHYLDLVVAARRAPEAAWRYLEPEPQYRALAGYVAFHAGRVDACYVEDERVTPQPGNYYGGWITRNIVGPFKGAPGSERW